MPDDALPCRGRELGQHLLPKLLPADHHAPQLPRVVRNAVADQPQGLVLTDLAALKEELSSLCGCKLVQPQPEVLRARGWRGRTQPRLARESAVGDRPE